MISIGSDRSMPECNHEEADTRIVVHILHAIQDNKAKSVLVRTVDTDVLVILIGKFQHLRVIQPNLDLWVGFGTGRNFSFISINTICAGLGEALLQHVNRSIYQAGIWTTSVDSQQIVPSPEEFSWKKEDGTWIPKWISIPEVSKACRELIRCTCKGVCKRCKCSKASLECTPLCNCKCVNTVDNS